VSDFILVSHVPIAVADDIWGVYVFSIIRCHES
jgi:hypothetical protein